MPAIPPPTNDTDDGFAQLGLRSNEARPRIIRQAALRQAEQLRGQVDLTEDESPYVDLAVSLYRVLDPRRRSTSTERAMLSQTEAIPAIEPHWLHPKARRRGRRRQRFGSSAHESLATGDWVFPDPDVSPPSQLQLALERWVIYARKRVIWATLLLALLVGMLIARQVSRSRPLAESGLVSPGNPRFVDNLEIPAEVAEPESSKDLEPIAPPEERDAAQADEVKKADELKKSGTSTPPSPPSRQTPPPQLPAAAVTGPEDPQDAMTSGSPAAAAGTSPAPAETKDDASNREMAQPTDRSRPGTPDTTNPEAEPEPLAEARPPENADSPENVTDDPAAQQPNRPPLQGTDVDRQSLDDPLFSELLPMDAPTVEPPRIATAAPEGATPERSPEPPIPRRTPLPDVDTLDAARRDLRAWVAQRPELRSAADRRQRIQELLTITELFEAGSIEVLVHLEMAALEAARLADWSMVEELIEQQVSQFETTPREVQVNLAQQLAASSGRDGRFAAQVGWIVHRANAALTEEALPAAKQLLRAAARLPVADEATEDRLQQAQQTLLIMERMQATADEILATSTLDDASPEESSSVGRYRSLMLRDWTGGLAWLAQGSDPRMAEAAAAEIAWRGDPDRPAEPAIEIADIWLAVAKRQRGRSAASARLHALDLLVEVKPTAAGLAELEVRRRLEAFEEEFPDLVQQAGSLQGSAAEAANPPAATEPPSGLLGRVTIAGVDAQVAIRYRPGDAITQNVVTQIFQRLGQPAEPFTMTFTGEIELAAETAVRIQASGPVDPGGQQSIRIGGNAVNLQDGLPGETATVQLTAGKHRLIWQFAGERLEQAFVILSDAQTGAPLTVTLPSEPRQTPTRLRINLIRDR